jgi:hypothetical protein
LPFRRMAAGSRVCAVTRKHRSYACSFVQSDPNAQFA